MIVLCLCVTVNSPNVLLGETRALLGPWQPGEPTSAFAERVLREDVLGRATVHRVTDILRVFSRRYRTPADPPASEEVDRRAEAEKQDATPYDVPNVPGYTWL